MRTFVKTFAAAALAAATFAVLPAASAETVTTTVDGGDLSASATVSQQLSTADTSTGASASIGSYDITVTDLRGTGAGWSVSQSVSDFTAPGITETIPGGNLTVSGFGAVEASTGSDAASTVAIGKGGALGNVANAAAGGGEGSYTIPVDVSLDIPAFTKEGTYTATLTVSHGPAIS